MTFFKRCLASLAAFIVCCVGSLSVMPSASAKSLSDPMVFTFSQFPVGYWDADIIRSEGSESISLNFNNLSSSSSGEIESAGMDRYTISFPIYNTSFNQSWVWTLLVVLLFLPLMAVV